MVVGCWGPRQQGRTSSSDYVTPVTAAPVRDCTPDCLRKPVTGRHPSCGRGIPVSLPLPATRAYARGLQGYRRITHPCSTLIHAFTRAIPCACSLAIGLSAVPPTSLAAKPTPPSIRSPLREHRHPHVLPTQPRPSLSLESPQGPLGSQG